MRPTESIGGFLQRQSEEVVAIVVAIVVAVVVVVVVVAAAGGGVVVAAGGGGVVVAAAGGVVVVVVVVLVPVVVVLPVAPHGVVEGLSLNIIPRGEAVSAAALIMVLISFSVGQGSLGFLGEAMAYESLWTSPQPLGSLG